METFNFISWSWIGLFLVKAGWFLDFVHSREASTLKLKMSGTLKMATWSTTAGTSWRTDVGPEHLAERVAAGIQQHRLIWPLFSRWGAWHAGRGNLRESGAVSGSQQVAPPPIKRITGFSVWKFMGISYGVTCWNTQRRKTSSSEDHQELGEIQRSSQAGDKRSGENPGQRSWEQAVSLTLSVLLMLQFNVFHVCLCPFQ